MANLTYPLMRSLPQVVHCCLSQVPYTCRCLSLHLVCCARVVLECSATESRVVLGKTGRKRKKGGCEIWRNRQQMAEQEKGGLRILLQQKKEKLKELRDELSNRKSRLMKLEAEKYFLVADLCCYQKLAWVLAVETYGLPYYPCGLSRLCLYPFPILYDDLCSCIIECIHPIDPLGLQCQFLHSLSNVETF